MTGTRRAFREPRVHAPLAWFGAFAFALAWLGMLYAGFEPRWATNDDVAMAMTAHGDGLATAGSPHLVFSSTLWGGFVRLIPDIDATSGYAIATILVLLAVGTVTVHGLARLGTGLAVAAVATALILTRPALLPQFTINAGLLMVAAVVSWRLYAQRGDRSALAIGCLLAFASYLVRSLEFALVLGVALPLLPWRTFLRERAARIALALLAVAIAVAAAIDHRAYQGPEWKTFNALNTTRAAYTDFRADERLRQRPDILARHGYSANDIDLVGNWFFVDPAIADPDKLDAMLRELGPVPEHDFARANLAKGLRIFWGSVLSVTFLAALLLAILRPGWRVAAAWTLCIGAAVAMSLAGRPGLPRVYMPLAFLLLLAPLLDARGWNERWRWWPCLAILAAAAAFNAHVMFKDARNLEAASEARRAEFAAFPTRPIVVWGGVFPFEALYPVLGRVPRADRLRLYGLGVMTWAPRTVAYDEQAHGRGLAALLVGDAGVSILAEPRHFVMLGRYCSERLGGRLETRSVQPFGAHRLTTVRCARPR